MRANAPAVALLLLAVVCLAQAAPIKPTLRDVLSKSKRSSSVATATTASPSYKEESYEDYGVETKEICLQEVDQKVCDFGDATDEIYFWTSDFICCQDEHYGYDARPVGGLRNSQLWGSQASIGSCDWTIWYSEYIDITFNVDKVGSAAATCWFGPESEECGGPLCDRMVMSLQGTAYYVNEAYSYWGEAETDGNCFLVFPAPVPRLGEGINGTAATGTAARHATPVDRAAKRAIPSPAQARRTAAGGTAKGVRGASRRTGGARALPKNPSASVQYNHGAGVVVDNRDVYYGDATIIMGIVTSMAGQRKEKWDEGVFEYVPYYSYWDIEDEGIDASYPWIRDKTYKMTFYKHGGDKYSSK